MKLIPQLFEPGIITLITAPVAGGKTRSIIEYFEDHPCLIIFISPLKALALEVYEKLKEHKNVYCLCVNDDRNQNKKDILLNFVHKKKAMLILTAELLEDEYLEFISSEQSKITFVFDEFHLFYSWGQGFRPILHDKLLGAIETQSAIIGLSATMNDDILSRLKNDLIYASDFFVHLDWGNLSLSKLPRKWHWFDLYEPKLLEKKFVSEMRKKNKKEVFLMFCPFRQDVELKLNWARRHGLVALDCVGGEVEEFKKELDKYNESIDCIFSTIALSHGVNLPEIAKVFINFEVKDYDLWLQMVGRGGRQGSPYEVYTFDKFHQSKKDLAIDYCKNFIYDLFHV
jgi:ATP-dependent DNA helicase RecQ